MMSEKTLSWFAGMVLCSLLLAGGCGPVSEEAVQLEVKPKKLPAKAEITRPVAVALKFVPKDVTTYKVTLDKEMTLKFEVEPSKKEKFKDKRNHDVIELTFTQQIRSIDSKGKSVADITIKKLKYFRIYQNNITLDFDSSRERDQSHLLAKLIGQSYTVKIGPTGKVIRIIDVTKARAAIKGIHPSQRTVLELLYPDKIKDRHGAVILPEVSKNQLRPGQSWSSLKTFSFPIVGPQSYERIYTLKEIKKRNDIEIAVVEMNGIPTAKIAEQLHKEQIKDNFAEMFSNTETYTGRLEFDLTSGKVEKYFEKLDVEWVVVDPESTDQAPSALKMGAVLVYRLEKVD